MGGFVDAIVMVISTKNCHFTPAASHRPDDKTDNSLTINEPSGQLSLSK